MSLYVDQKVAYLSTMDLFQDLNQDDLMLMERQLTMASCQRGKIFYMPDDTGQVLFLLKRGRVQLYRISPGGLIASAGRRSGKWH